MSSSLTNAVAAIIGIAAVIVASIMYWRAGAVWRAWRAYLIGNPAKAEDILQTVRSPERLGGRKRAYYEWLVGEAVLRHGDPATARVHLHAAASGRLRSNRDRSFALARLAEAAVTDGDVAAARDAVAQARSLRPPPFVQVLLADVEAACDRSPGS